MEIKSLDTEFLRDLTIPSLKSLHSRESYLSTLKLSSYVVSLKTDTQNLRNNDIKVQCQDAYSRGECPHVVPGSRNAF